jgi:hypothetical protein
LGSHHSPFAHSAELTVGVAMVTAAIVTNAMTIGANAIMTTGPSRRTNVLVGRLP